MPMISKTLLVSTVVALGGLTALAATANAAPHRHKMMKAKGVPAHLKTGYHGAAGFVGGVPGRATPALFDEPAPMGIFKGFPILGDIGL